MSYGRNYSPYRVPCSGSIKDCFPGAKYQHSNGSLVDIYTNVTTVKKSHDDPSSVVPYTRRNQILNPCSGLYPPCTDADYYCGQWIPLHMNGCGVGETEFKKNCVTKGATKSVQKCRQVGFQNLLMIHPWHGEYGPMSGHWQAPSDFCYEDVEGIDETFTAVGIVCSIIPERTSADQTKYRTITAQADWEWSSPCEGFDTGATTWARTITVDKKSGERVLSDCIDPDFSHPGGLVFLPAWPATPSEAAGVAVMNVNDADNRYRSKLGILLAAAAASPGTTVSRSGFTWTCEHDYSGTVRTAWVLTNDPASGIFEYTKYDWVNGSCRFDSGLLPGDLSWGISEYESLNLTSTGLTYNGYTNTGQTDGQAHGEVTITADYSDAQTVTDHRTDWDTLRAQWDWDDLNIYPPRGWLIESGVITNYDERVTQAPLICYNGSLAPVSPVSGITLTADSCSVDDYENPLDSVPHALWDQRAWFDPDCYRWEWAADGDDSTNSSATGLTLIRDGSILGAPGYAGSDGHFNFEHTVIERCFDSGSGTWITYVYGYGNWNPATTVSGAATAGHEGNALFPIAATCWTNLEQEANGIPAKYLKWDGDVLIGMDYREIKLNFPAQDFARPYGADRWAMVETSTGCIKSVAGADIEVDFGTGTNTITTSDYVIIGGAEYDPGLYPVTGVAGDIITVGAKICDNPLSTAGNYLGKARYPSCPAFGGRLQIKGAVQSGPTLTLELFEAAPYLRTGDQIDTTGDSIPATTYTVTKVDDTHFEITATLIGAYGGQAWMTYHGGTPHAAPYYFVDNKSKGDYCLATWSGNLGEREWQERHRVITLRAETGCSCMSDPGPEIREHQATNGMPRWVTDFTFETHCVPVVPCPAQFIPMPEFPALSADGIYGNQWQAMVFQTMQELFWQAPHFPCDSYDPDTPPPPPLWEMDSTGNGNGDCAKTYTNGGGTEVKLYPHYPLVEARAEIPSGAPALPSDVKIGVAPLSDLQLATPVSGLPALPPRAAIGWLDDLPNIPQSFWVLTARQCNCIAGAGELGTDYAAYNLPCVE